SNCQIIWETDEFKWQRFTSIPSSMWYVMINLLKEHPLAEFHETLLSRTLVCICCIFAMPLFALPSSILQCSLFDADQKDDAEEVARAGDAAHTRRMTYQADAAQLLELQAESQQKMRPGFATTILVFGSILAYFYYTARDTDHATFFTVPVHVSKTTLAYIDGTVAICFLCEYASRMSVGGGSYITSGYGLVDLLAWLPGLLHLCTYESMGEHHHEILCAACVLRIFKLERYLHSFRDMLDIVKENGGILTATLVLSMFLWMFFSTMLFLTEKHNPDDEMNDEVYGSVMRSLWSEIINLHGEWPWADYTPMGKAVGTVIGLFSIMLFCIPIGIFGEGFMERVRADRELSTEDDDFDRRPWQECCRPEPGMRQKVYDMLYEDLHPNIYRTPTMLFRTLRACSVVMVVATTFITAVATVEDWGGWKGRDTTTDVGKIFWVVDVLATVWFILEYILRIVATGWRHPVSLVGLCDLISIAAFAYTLDPKTRPEAFRPGYQDTHYLIDSVVLLRLLRVFSLESYFYAMHTLRCVLWLNKWPLARAGGALVSIWFVHATLLYICENPRALGGAVPPAGEDGKAAGEGEEDDGLSMVQRYRSVLSALQYSIVHLFGDYPETDYTVEAKIIHFVGIMGGIAIISTFCGVFSAGFVDFLETNRTEEANQKSADFLRATVQIKLGLKRVVANRRSRGNSGTPAPAQRTSVLGSTQSFARAIKFHRTPTGAGIALFFNTVLVVSLINTMAASIPEIDNNKTASTICLVVEAACTVVFIVDYVVRLLARPKSVFNFFGIIDLIGCLPGIFVFYNWLSRGHPHSDKESIAECFSMLRAVRILNFHVFQTEVQILGRVLQDASRKLAVPAYLALNVWITTSALFMWLENEWQNEATECEAKHAKEQCGGPGTFEDMPDVPSAMYWCSIFLTGEWANVDFTYAGSRLCIFYVVFGIAIFSIPVGILVEAVKGSRNYHVQFGVWRQFKYSMSPATSYEAVGECGPS
ncbi:kcna2, partial [Symbiodinium microadriaticum]